MTQKDLAQETLQALTDYLKDIVVDWSHAQTHTSITKNPSAGDMWVEWKFD
jgi:hypothetical protein